MRLRDSGGAVLLALAAAFTCAGCGGEEPQEREPPAAEARDPVADDLVRARAEAVVLGPAPSWTRAAELLAPLAARPDATLDDLVRAAIVDLQLEKVDTATALVARAYQLAPDDPSVSMLRAGLFKRSLDFEQAADAYRQVLRGHPTDLAAQFQLGETLENLGDFEGALKAYDAVLATGRNFDR